MGQDHSAELSERLPWPAEPMTGLAGYPEEARRAR